MIDWDELKIDDKVSYETEPDVHFTVTEVSTETDVGMEWAIVRHPNTSPRVIQAQHDEGWFVIEPISTLNDWLLGSNGETFAFTLPIIPAFDADTGLRMAAWLVTLCSFGVRTTPKHTFEEYLEAVQNT